MSDTQKDVFEEWRAARWRAALTAQAKAFGIAIEELLAKLQVQAFTCPLCGRPLARAHVDTRDDGALRGLLCGRCFTFLRKIGDDPLRAVVRKRDRKRRVRAYVYLHGGTSSLATH